MKSIREVVKVANQNEPPTEEALNLKKQGLSDDDIVKNLQDNGYSSQQISDAMNQAGIKETIEAPAEVPMATTLEEAPAPGSEVSAMPAEAPPEAVTMAAPQYTEQAAGGRAANTEAIEEIAESIINEKWEELMSSLGNIVLWKEKVETDIKSIKQEIVRMQERSELVQRAVLGKVGEYDQHIMDIGGEMKALEKVMEKIIEPLTENIKELNRVTVELKTKVKK